MDQTKLDAINKKFGFKIQYILQSKKMKDHCNRFLDQTPEFHRLGKIFNIVATCKKPQISYNKSLPDDTVSKDTMIGYTLAFYHYFDSLTGNKYNYYGKTMGTMDLVEFSDTGRSSTGYIHNHKTGNTDLKITISTEQVANNHPVLAHELWHSFDQKNWTLSDKPYGKASFLGEIGPMYIENAYKDWFLKEIEKNGSFDPNTSKEMHEKLEHVFGDVRYFDNIDKAIDAYLDYLIVGTITSLNPKEQQKYMEIIADNYRVLWGDNILGSKIDQIINFIYGHDHYDPMMEGRYIIGAAINKGVKDSGQPEALVMDKMAQLNSNILDLNKLDTYNLTSAFDIATTHFDLPSIEKLTNDLAKDINTRSSNYNPSGPGVNPGIDDPAK